MSSAPIKRLFDVSRHMIDPVALGNQEVFHYSLPAWHEFGRGILQSASDLSSGKLFLQGGEILVSKLNPEKSVVIRAQSHEVPTVCSPEMIALIPQPGGIDWRYAYYLMLSGPVRHGLESSVESVTNSHKRARVDRFLASRISYPVELATQNRIADFLDRETARIDQLIEKKQRLVVLLEEKASSVGSALVLGIDHGGKPSAETAGVPWLSHMPKHWDALTLSQLTKTFGGSTPSKDNETFWNGTTPWVSPKDMKFDIIMGSQDHISEDAIETSGLRVIEPGTVLIVTRGMILAHSVPVALLGTEATINQDMKALVPGPQITGDYLLCMLQGLKSVLLSFVEESAHGTKKLRSERLFKTRFPVPPVDEQMEIAKRILQLRKSTSEIIRSTRNSVEVLQEFRSALITAAVTGQIDVDEWQRRETTDRRLDEIEEEMRV